MQNKTEEANNFVQNEPKDGQTAIQVTFQPTLFIYLGTTPGQVGYRLKKLLNRAYGEVPVLRHLWVDLDTKIIPQARPLFRGDERAELSGVEPAAVIKNLNYYPAIKDWWPTGSRVSAGKLTSDGANLQMRLVGRLALFRMYNERVRGMALIDKLKTATEAMFEIENTSGTIAKSTEKIKYSVGEGCQVVIVHSTGGGSGSALCFDIAYLCQHLLDGKHPNVTSIAILPSVIAKGMTNQNQSQIEKVRANTYAWFREENYLTEKSFWRVQYPEGAPIEVSSPPFDFRYVVDIENQANQRLDAQEDVFDMISQAIFLETGSSIGGEMRGLDAIAHVLKDDFINMPRSFSSMAAASLIYPKQRLLDYCANRFGSALLREGLLGKPNDQQVKVDTASLQSQLRLGDADLMADLLSGIQIKMDREQAILKADSVGTALTQVDSQEIVNKTARDEARKQLDQISNEHLENLKKGLNQDITRLASTRGLAFAQAVIGKLLATTPDTAADADVLSFNGLKNRLHQQGIYENDLKNTMQEYASARAILNKLDDGLEDMAERFISPNGWKKKFKQAKADIVNKMKNTNEVSLQQAAQKKAVDIYNQLAAYTGTLDTRLAGAITSTSGYSDELEEAYGDLSRTSAAQATTFEFTQEIKIDFSDYYGKHAVQAKANEAFSGMIPFTVTDNMGKLVDWITDSLKENAVIYANRYFFDALEKTSLLSTLQEMAEKAGIQPQALIESHLDRLVKYCHPFWKFEENRGLSATDGVSILGIEDENSPLIPSSYRKNRLFQIKTTGFLDRIDLLRTAHGMPAFLLKGMEDYRVDYEKLRKGWDPLHILKDMDLAPDVFPEQGRGGRDLFARALAFGYIVQLVNWFYFDPKRDYEKDGIKPGREFKLANGRENSAEAFSHRDDWQGLADESINKDVIDMGNKAAIQKLEESIKALKKLTAAATTGEESIRKQLEREVKSLQDFQRELGKIG